MIARWAACASLIFALSLPTLARADGAAEPNFDQLLQEAMDAYRARDYDRAVKEFEAAYKLRAEPELLYNIARSHERALRRKPAIEAYERFLATPGTTAELRGQALASLEALKREEAALERASTTGQKLTDVGGGQGATGGVTTAPPRTRGSSSVVPWVLIAGGGALAIAGGVVGVEALSAKSEFDKATDGGTKLQYRDEAKREALFADVLIGAGVLAAGIGVVWKLVGSSDESVAVAPQVGPDGASLVFAGAF